ncbi:unnamed protein product, partial [marine sediment metagenome]
GVEFIGNWETLLSVGLILGLINSFIRPILKFITLPLRMLTFGLFGLVINMGMIWLVDILFTKLIITGLIPLFWTTLIIWGLGLMVSLFIPKRRSGIIE